MTWRRSCLYVTFYVLMTGAAGAQPSSARSSAATTTMQEQVERLAAAVAQQQVNLASSQRQIESLREQVSELERRLQTTPSAPVNDPPPQGGEEYATRLNGEIEKLREQQDVQQGEIETHEQSKVESGSKFPVKLTGLILMNSFANSSGVDVIQSPGIAIAGPATTGISLSQTVLGLDARGPHFFGATTSADVRVDFAGGLGQGNYAESGGIVRFRTAHAEAAWSGTRAFFELDRPIVNPNTPTSLTAIALPALGWSGNLWNWIPQVGVEHNLQLSDASRLTLQVALADVPDPVFPGANNAMSLPVASLSEQSRWLGSESRIGYSRGNPLTGLQVGVGGYFSPHSEPGDFHFDAWAATVDYRVPLFGKLEASGNFYRGVALGGLGGGAFKDYLYGEQGETDFFRPLDDVGGWSQLKARATARLQLNAAFGIDNAFASEIRPYLTFVSAPYGNLARNSTFFTNAIYSPTAYTLFSFEYRRIDSSPATGPHSIANVYGVAAGYRF